MTPQGKDLELHTRSVMRQLIFVCIGGVVTGVTWIATPVLLYRIKDWCDKDLCISLERDVTSAMDPSTDACVDFYQHVCGRWGKQGQAFLTPLDKYRAYHRQETLRKLLLQEGSTSQRNVGAKVTLMLKKCGRDSRVEGALRMFLQSVHLDWPNKSEATRLQLLDILVELSMDHGLPAMWYFMIGRHPTDFYHNIIYLTLDSAVTTWMAHLKQLIAKRAVDRYFRRCAEIVGGTGQSYELMIRDVLLVNRYGHVFFLQKFQPPILVRPPATKTNGVSMLLVLFEML